MATILHYAPEVARFALTLRAGGGEKQKDMLVYSRGQLQRILKHEGKDSWFNRMDERLCRWKTRKSLPPFRELLESVAATAATVSPQDLEKLALLALELNCSAWLLDNDIRKDRDSAVRDFDDELNGYYYAS